MTAIARNRSTRRWLAVACAVGLTASACGSRLSRQEILAQNTVRDTSAAAARGTAGAAAGTGGDAAGNAAGHAGEAGGSGGVGGDISGGAGGESAGTKAPIVVGLIGWLSGLGGGELNPARDAWVAWQRDVNAKGGINGHPVQLLIGDDQGNASTGISIARDFVENQGAIVLTSVDASIRFADYAKEKSVPVIGTIPGTSVWNENPMLFPPFPATESASWGAARLMKRAGKTKVAFMGCVETEDCSAGKDKFVKYAEEEGLTVVYTGQYTVVQPDFTSDCLQLQSKGAEAVLPVGDNNSMVRMAQDCSRQGYHPVWVTATPHDSLAQNPDFADAIAVTGAFPWFMRTENPAIADYAAALQQYAPERLSDGSSFLSWAWQSAKVLELAAANVSDTPTSQDILNGLWSMQGNTIEGLAPEGMARTYTQGQPTTEILCIFDTKIQGGAWVAPQGLTPVCR